MRGRTLAIARNEHADETRNPNNTTALGNIFVFFISRLRLARSSCSSKVRSSIWRPAAKRRAATARSQFASGLMPIQRQSSTSWPLSGGPLFTTSNYRASRTVEKAQDTTGKETLVEVGRSCKLACARLWQVNCVKTVLSGGSMWVWTCIRTGTLQSHKKRGQRPKRGLSGPNTLERLSSYRTPRLIEVRSNCQKEIPDRFPNFRISRQNGSGFGTPPRGCPPDSFALDCGTGGFASPHASIGLTIDGVRQDAATASPPYCAGHCQHEECHFHNRN